MSTDHTNLPSVMDVKSRWEQIANANDSSSSVTTGNHENARPTHRPTKSFSAPRNTPLNASALTTNNFPNESTPNLSTQASNGSLNTNAPKSKPVIAPKPARLSATFSSLSLSDRERLQAAPEITMSAPVSPKPPITNSNVHHSAPTLMGPPARPPSRPLSPMSVTGARGAGPPPPPSRRQTPPPTGRKPIPPPSRSPQPPTAPRPIRPSRVVSEGNEAYRPSYRSVSGGSDTLVVPETTAKRTVTPPEFSHRTTSPASTPRPPPPPPPPRRVPSSTSHPNLLAVPQDGDSLGPPAPDLPPRTSARSVSPNAQAFTETSSTLEPAPQYQSNKSVVAPSITPPPPPPRPSVVSGITTVPVSSIGNNTAAHAATEVVGLIQQHPQQQQQHQQYSYTHENSSTTSLGSIVNVTDDDDSELILPPDQNYPDSSQANRRAPIFEGQMHAIPTKAEVKATAAYGRFICVCGTSTRVIDLHSGECIWTLNHHETKVTAAHFRITTGRDGRLLWLGTKEGHIWEVSLDQNAPVHKRANCHLTPIVLIHQYNEELWTLSDDGKLCVWNGDLTSNPRIYRTTPNFKGFTALGGQLWIGRTRQASVYQPSLQDNAVFAVTSRPIPAFTSVTGRQAGEFSCAGWLPANPDQVLFGHEDGTVTIFSISRLIALESINVATTRITALRGVGHYLWIGLRSGKIMVCDVSCRPWKVLKEWKAHEGPVMDIACDDNSLKAGMLPVITYSTDMVANIWDGLLKHDWIEMDMFQHDEEYSSFSAANVHVITWNTGAAKPSDLERNRVDNDFLSNMLRAYGDSPDLIVFGFQELVELDNTTVTAKSMFTKRKKRDKEVSVASHISHQYKAWQDRLFFAVCDAYGEKYRLIHSNNMVGLFTCVFLKESMMPSLQGIRSSVVKTGLGGLHGNKGGLAVRMILENTSLCFVNCHLAAGQSSSLQRNKDIEAILETELTDESVNTQFTGKGIFVNGGDGTLILDHEICFFSGDMNYRINTQRPTAMKLLESQDYEKLLELDQLTIQLNKNAGMRLRAFKEMPIAFPPTYKYDVGTDNYDTSEKKRVPAWCDRVFYRGGRRITPLHYSSHVVRVSDHRPVSGLYKVQIKTIDKTLRNEAYKRSLERWNNFLEQAVEASRAL